MENKTSIKVGITIGDINGVGLEVILKALSNSDVYANSTPIIYGSSKAISFHKKAINDKDFKKGNWNAISKNWFKENDI